MVLALLSLSGCVPQIRPVQRRFAREFHCPLKETKARSLGAGAYQVRGCGNAAQYVCVGDAFEIDQRCVREYGADQEKAAQSPAPTPPMPRIARIQSPDGSATLKLTLQTVAAMIELRVGTRAETELAVATISPGPSPEPCTLDLVIDGVRKDLPPPTARSQSGAPRFFQELPLGLLAELAVSSRALGRICNRQFALTDAQKASLRELLMRLREEQAFGQAGAPAAPKPESAGGPTTDI